MEEIKELDRLENEIDEMRDIQTEIAKVDEIKREISALAIPVSLCLPIVPVRTQPRFPEPPNAMVRAAQGESSVQRDDVDFCEACNNLEEADNLFANGLTSEECQALFKNRGLGINSAESNCETLQDLVDCLIGQHKRKLDVTNFCDIKEWLAQLMANIWNVKSALVCDSCGQWEQIRLLWIQTREIWEQIRSIWAELARIKEEILDRIECVRQELHQRITDEINQLERRIEVLEREGSEVRQILSAILTQMRSAGAWSSSGSPSTAINLAGAPIAGINLAAGNINLFSGANATGANPTNFIRTRAGINNNDLAGGV